VPLFFEVWQKVVPTGVAAGERLFDSGVLLALARSGADVQEVVSVIERTVADVAA